MIKYNFICGANHTFDMWFKSYDFCEQQLQKKGEIICPICGISEIKKQLSAPAMVKQTSIKSRGNSKPNNVKAQNPTDVEKVYNYLKKLENEVKNKYEYVGDNFKEVALQMHNHEIPAKNIYGEATLQETKELIAKGIGVLPLPLSSNKKFNNKKIN